MSFRLNPEAIMTPRGTMDGLDDLAAAFANMYGERSRARRGAADSTQQNRASLMRTAAMAGADLSGIDPNAPDFEAQVASRVAARQDAVSTQRADANINRDRERESLRNSRLVRMRGLAFPGFFDPATGEVTWMNDLTGESTTVNVRAPEAQDLLRKNFPDNFSPDGQFVPPVPGAEGGEPPPAGGGASEEQILQLLETIQDPVARQSIEMGLEAARAGEASLDEVFQEAQSLSGSGQARQEHASQMTEEQRQFNARRTQGSRNLSPVPEMSTSMAGLGMLPDLVRQQGPRLLEEATQVMGRGAQAVGQGVRGVTEMGPRQQAMAPLHEAQPDGAHGGFRATDGRPLPRHPMAQQGAPGRQAPLSSEAREHLLRLLSAQQY